MKDREKEEVKEIVKEAMKEQNENTEKIIKKEKKSKKKIIIISSIIGGLLLIAAIVFLFMFILKPTYKIAINDGGGVILKEPVIEDNVVKSMPEYTPPEGKRLVTWVNKKGEAVREGIKLEEDDTWDPIVGLPIEDTPDPSKYVTLKFVSGTDEKIPDIVIEKGSGLILPVRPNNYKDWKFLYWVDENEYIGIIGTKVEKNMTFYAYWWKPGTGGTSRETVRISFDTGTDEKLNDINLIKGSKIIYYTPSVIKEGKVFRGWLDEQGNLMKEDAVAEKDMKLKANWKEPYTCPSDCKPNEDGSKCTKTTVVAPSKQTVCPATEWTNDYGQTYCIDLNTKEYDRQCASAEPFGTDEVEYPYEKIVDEFGENWKICCVKKVDYVDQYSCPAGYERDGDNCKLVETINCTQN